MSEIILVSRGVVDYIDRQDIDGLIKLGIPEQYINDFEDCQDYFTIAPQLNKFLRTYMNMEMDRTGSIKYPIKVKNMYPLPVITPETENSSFEDICLKKAQELIDTNRFLKIAWSGGVDSTCLLAALLMCDVPKDQLMVCGTYTSVHENPEFYNNVLLKQKIPHKFYSLRGAVVEALYEDGEIFVTGEAGDQLGVGQMSILSTYAPDKWHKHYSESIDQKTLDDLERHIQVANEYLPEPLETLTDLIWWGAFNMSFQHVCLRTLSGMPHLNNWKDNICHFFDSEEFQTWAILNRDKKIKDHEGSYKYEFKDLIYKYDGGEDYWKTKSKVISHREMFNHYHHFFLLFEDGTINYLKE